MTQVVKDETLREAFLHVYIDPALYIAMLDRKTTNKHILLNYY